VADQVGSKSAHDEHGRHSKLGLMTANERIVGVVLIIVVKCRPRAHPLGWLNRLVLLFTARTIVAGRSVGATDRLAESISLRPRLDCLERLYRILSFQLVIHGAFTV
jgi:hypothetical protein